MCYIYLEKSFCPDCNENFFSETCLTVCRKDSCEFRNTSNYSKQFSDKIFFFIKLYEYSYHKCNKENFEKWIEETLSFIKNEEGIKEMPDPICECSHRRIDINVLEEECKNYYEELMNIYYKNLDISENKPWSRECRNCIKYYSGED